MKKNKNCITIYTTESPALVVNMINNNRRVNVALSDIIYLESQENYTIFYLRNGKTIINSRTMGIYEDLFGQHAFFRVHRSFLVNFAYVNKVDVTDNYTGVIHLSNHRELLISRRKVKPFLERYNDFKNNYSQLFFDQLTNKIAA